MHPFLKSILPHNHFAYNPLLQSYVGNSATSLFNSVVCKNRSENAATERFILESNFFQPRS